MRDGVVVSTVLWCGGKRVFGWREQFGGEGKIAMACTMLVSMRESEEFVAGGCGNDFPQKALIRSAQSDASSDDDIELRARCDIERVSCFVPSTRLRLLTGQRQLCSS